MVAVLARHEAKAVVLDLMQPDQPRGRAIGLRGQAWGNEARRQGALQHAHVIGQQGLGESRRKPNRRQPRSRSPCSLPVPRAAR
jgi:hypothetical protein